MNPDDFITRLQHHQIVEAIHQAESNNTGHIRIFISHAPAPDPLATEMATHFKSNNPMQAIITVIQQAGKLLGTHFPKPAPTETNRAS